MKETLNKEEQLKETKSQDTKAEEEIDLNMAEENKMVKRVDHDTLLLNGDAYKIIENYREALDLEMLEARYSDFLEKYDYIVGDISYEKLRLRGFYYSKNKKVPIDMRISSLKDYITEYCSFGCAYFVLERIEPKRKQSNQPKRKNRSNQNKKNTQNKKQKGIRKFDDVKSREKKVSEKRPVEKKPSEKKKENKKTFTKKDRQPAPQTKKEPAAKAADSKVKTVKDNKGETKFKIRQKNKSE